MRFHQGSFGYRLMKLVSVEFKVGLFKERDQLSEDAGKKVLHLCCP